MAMVEIKRNVYNPIRIKGYWKVNRKSENVRHRVLQKMLFVFKRK